MTLRNSMQLDSCVLARIKLRSKNLPGLEEAPQSSSTNYAIITGPSELEDLQVSQSTSP